MTDNPLASIVINNYNYGRFLAEAIDSALAQTYANVEVIVVDDGSTDNSRDVIASYGNRVRPILKENGGQGSAYNVGFAASRGDIVLFLDSDDMLLPTAFEKAVPHFDDPEVVKVHWPLRMVDEQGQPTGQLCPGPVLPQGDLRAHVLTVGPTNHLSAPSSGNAWSRSFLERLLPLPEALYNNGCDTCLFEVAPFLGRLKALSEPQTLYRQHGRNDHASFTIEDKVQRELRFYEHYCGVLERHFANAGITVVRRAWQRNSWWHRHAAAIQAIKALPRPEMPIILVDDATLEVGPIGGRRRIPFTERGGDYGGPPADDDDAIGELERLRQTGASHLVFAWPAFWWLGHYAGFVRHLHANYVRVLDNDCVVAFDLNTGRRSTPQLWSATTAVCVLGMHRSGTSLLAGVLNLLGVYLGPPHALLPAAPDNPRGFWEHREFIDINDELLARVGGNAMHPPTFPPGWPSSARVQDLEQRARAMLHEDFRATRLWGWKDPRTCLTLPFWERMLPRLRFLLCFRHPADVARSLQRREPFPRLRALQLWLTHVRFSLLHTEGKPRLLVTYERLVDAWEEEVNRVAEFLDQPPLSERPAVHQAVRAFLDPGLRHHRTAPGAAVEMAPHRREAQLLELTEQVYLALCDPAVPSISKAMSLMDEALAVSRMAMEASEAADEQRWKESVNDFAAAIAEAIPAGAAFILVDHDQIGRRFPDRSPIPFLERNGRYWGPPGDANTAIREMERLRRSGAAFIAFPWFAFWWLDYYREFARDLRANYRCVVDNDRLVLFDLREKLGRGIA